MSHMDLYVTNPATVVSGGEYDTLTNVPQSGKGVLVAGGIPGVTESFVDAVTTYTPVCTSAIAEIPVNGIGASGQNQALSVGAIIYMQTNGTFDGNGNTPGAVPFGTLFGNSLNNILNTSAGANNLGVDTRTGVMVLSGAVATYVRVWVGKFAQSALTARNVQVARALYSFAVDGGAIGAITPVQSDWIPANAIVYGGVINSSTAVTSGGSATVAIGTTAGSAANSILTATGKASFTLDAVLVPTAVATPFKMSAAGQINLTVAAAALTAGIIEVLVFYNVATNA